MLNFKNASIVSLGYACETATMLLKQQTPHVPSVFDRMATPMWAVAQLVSNNFSNFLGNVQSMTIFENNPEAWLVDTQYYIRLFPKDVNSAQYAKYKTAQLARAQNFSTNLAAAAAANTPVLFVRTQEPTSYSNYGTRIMYPQYAAQYQQSEYVYLQQFSQTMKAAYPTLQYQILFMSDMGAFSDSTNNIVGIDKPSGNFRSPNIASIMEQNVAAHAEHLTLHLGSAYFVQPVPKPLPKPAAVVEPTKKAEPPAKPAYKPMREYRHYFHF